MTTFRATIKSSNPTEQSALDKLKKQLNNQGKAISELITAYEQIADQTSELADFKEEFIHHKKYIEILIDDAVAEIDSVKTDLLKLTAEVQELKQMINPGIEQPDDDDGPQPQFAAQAKRTSDFRALFSDLPGPSRERILSSMPPRKLSEDEALELLMAVDKIIKGRVSEPPS
jgi:hypothetical protein